MLKKEVNYLPKYAAGDPGFISADITAQVTDLKVNESAYVHLTESERVCVSEFCRLCWGVLKMDEGEEWGLSHAWGK